jgi:acyl transferase domain-containing protein
MGCVFPGAANLKEFWRTLARGEDGITEVPPTHWSPADYFDADPKRPDHTYCSRGGYLSPVQFDPTQFGIPPSILEATDTTQLLALHVAKMALADAGYDDSREFDRERAGVILGITGTQELVISLGARLGHPLWRKSLAEAGVDPKTTEEVIRRISDGYVSWQENSFPGLLGNVVAGRIANRLNLRGTNCVIDAACASSLGAVHLAMLELATGRADMILSGGADTLNDIFMHMCFSKTPALSPTGDARPFSANADGTVLGEGIGMVVLKRLADAERDGDRVYAVIRGMGTSSDGRSQSIYAPHAAGQARCLRNAYELAGISPQSVSLLEAHGTGTTVGDATEFDALRTVFREARGGGAWCALGSVKSQIGHTKAAAGAAGMVKAAFAIYHASLPPTLKISEPNPKMGIGDSPFYLNTELRPWLTDRGAPRRAGVSSFGFGGSNFHVVLEEHGVAREAPAWDGSVEIIALSADSHDSLVNQLAVWSEAVRRPEFDRTHLAWMACESRRDFCREDTHRLLIVVEHGDDLSVVLGKATDRLATGADRWTLPNIFHSTTPAEGKLAFLFPGQGSQYVGMARRMACVFPELRAALTAADQGFEGPVHSVSDAIYPTPVFTGEARQAHEDRLRRTDFAQPALGAIEWGMSKILGRFGIRPDAVCGHSYGELVALSVAGVLDESTLMGLSRLRGRLMAGDGEDRGAMLAVKASPADLAPLITESRLDVVLANLNSPSQCVLSGSHEAIDRAAEACKALGFASTKLQVSGAFHSPLMADAAESMRSAIEASAFAGPQFPVIAGSSAAPYPGDPNEAKTVLAGQLLSPVNFVGQIESLYDFGVRTFLEVGPKPILTGLVGSILKDRPHTAISMDASAGRKCGISDLGRLVAQLAAAGQDVDLTQWEAAAKEPRKPKMVVPLVGANYRSPRPATERSEKNEPTKRPPPATAPARPVMLEQAPKSTKMSDTPDLPSVSLSPRRSEPDQSANVPSVSPVLTDALRVMQEGLRSMQSLQQQTAAAHEKFLATQEQAHRAFQQLLESQHRLVSNSLNRSQPSYPPLSLQPLVEASKPIAVAPPQAHQAPPVYQAPSVSIVESPRPKAQSVTFAAPAPEAQASSVVPDVARSRIEPVVQQIVCEKTGYPLEMITLEMDIEADLGIDSIKRVEIISAIEERLPGLPTIKPEHMGSLRSLGQIVDFMAGGAVDAQPTSSPRPTEAPKQPIAPSVGPAAATSAQNADVFGQTLLSVVAERTGYPPDMLNLDMDMEADLGIDSIKRVEILAGVEALTPDLPPVKPEFMGSLRTLRQVVEYYLSQSPAAPTTAPTCEQVVSSPVAPREIELEPRNSSLLNRGVLIAVETQPPRDRPLNIATDGEIWVTDDGEGLSSAIIDECISAGIGARLVNLSEISGRTKRTGVVGLIIVSPIATSGSIAGRESSDVFLREALMAARLVSADLCDAAKSGRAVFATITRLDGAMGLVGGDFDPVIGGLAGLTKTAALEWPEVCCRAIDVSPDWSDLPAAASAILRELAADGPTEVGLGPGRRLEFEVQQESAKIGTPALCADDLVIVTGGARGVTAESVMALARQCAPRLILLGRSPVPVEEPSWLAALTSESDIKQAILKHAFAGQRPTPTELQTEFGARMAAREIRRNIDRIAATGASVAYEAVDVRDAEALREVMQRIIAKHGPVRGLIYAAGTLEDRLIKDKTAEQFAKVFDTKIVGLRNIIAELDLDELRQVVLFSSVSARYGNVGQSDYAMSNESLNKIARRIGRELPRCRVTSINWGPWDGGMVTPALRREFVRQGIDLIPLTAGADAMVTETLVESGNVEVVVGAPLNRRKSVRVEPVAASADPTGDLSIAFQLDLDAERFPFLRSHVLGGRPVLPVAMMVEWMAHAALHANPGLLVRGIDDLRILKAAALGREGTLGVMLAVSRSRRDGDAFFVDAELRSVRKDGLPVIHAHSKILLAAQRPPAPVAPEEHAVIDRAYPRNVESAYEENLFHGPHLRGIREIRGLSSRGIVGRVVSAGAPRDWMAEPLRGAWIADPLILDAAFQLAILWCCEELGAPSLPTHFGRLRLYSPSMPRDGVTCILQVREATRARMSSDISFVDAAGALVAEISGYECTVDPLLWDAFRPPSRLSAAS